VGAHYPGDVLAGLALGAGTTLALWPVANRLLRPALEMIGVASLAFLVTGATTLKAT